MELEPGFSTADAEYPSVSLKDGTLDLFFVDWREQPVSVRFRDAASVSWQQLEITGPNVGDDKVYEIQNSNWIASHYRQQTILPAEKLRHFRLCFNAWGTLDVIASEMEIVRA